MAKGNGKIETPEEFRNVDVAIKGNKMVITVNLEKDCGPSKSGKTILVATTGGNKKIPDRDEFLGVNLYKYPPK